MVRKSFISTHGRVPDPAFLTRFRHTADSSYPLRKKRAVLWLFVIVSDCQARRLSDCIRIAGKVKGNSSI
ncbi:hypothetical protein HNY73_015378 [Argiope bruennichi]|uniref:Uncharacterized protein n=1 Tax=Argiope bruennichi TaxID=94029 RepID=A0A8T0ETB0_ARGBR|nr:hypothetical protein HNY73_015378 [Argiope bruennichi]